jgi:hypothetical protein
MLEITLVSRVLRRELDVAIDIALFSLYSGLVVYLFLLLGQVICTIPSLLS